MLRKRDCLAALLLAWLSHSIFRTSNNNLNVTVQLRFVVPHSQHVQLLDVDGDGRPEALVRLEHEERQQATKLIVYDLRPMGTFSHHGLFQPDILFESQTISAPAMMFDDDSEDVPLQALSLATGHVLSSSNEPPNNGNDDTTMDRTLFYYCGTDWHDASQKCQVPCPSGQSNDCPDNERCYADTPCYKPPSTTADNTHLDTTNLETTPGGGLPGMLTVYTQGVITLHSLVYNVNDKQLELKQVWSVSPLQSPTTTTSAQIQYWEDDCVTLFVDALNSGTKSGLWIVAGTILIRDKQETSSNDSLQDVQVVLALDALKGDVVWKFGDSLLLDAALSTTTSVQQQDIPLPLQVAEPGTSSAARRRSLLPVLRKANESIGTSRIHCLREYRRSILISGALPYQMVDNPKMFAMHFDHQAPTVAKPKKRTKKRHVLSIFGGGRSAKHRRHPKLYGKPNVIVVHSFSGIQVISMKNGRSVCHLSLQPYTLYEDLNHDGSLDSARIVFDNHLNNMDDEEAESEQKFIQALADRVTKSKAKTPETPSVENTMKHLLKQDSLCHLLVMSGLPTKEELYSKSLCRTPDENLEAAPVLALDHSSKGHDLVTALNDGSVARFRGATGRRVWHHEYKDFPKWDDPSSVLVDRIDSKNLVPSARPVVIAGTDAVTILDVFTGKQLASIAFPQPTVSPPRLLDLTVDGTSDLLVTTADAVWGYQVSVQTGASVGVRIFMGLLIMGILLAILRNRFGPQPGRRSSDP